MAGSYGWLLQRTVYGDVAIVCLSVVSCCCYMRSCWFGDTGQDAAVAASVPCLPGLCCCYVASCMVMTISAVAAWSAWPLVSAAYVVRSG